MASLLDTVFPTPESAQALGLLGAQWMQGNPGGGFQAAFGILSPEAKLKRQLIQAQVDSIASEAATRQAALQAAQRKQAALPSILGYGAVPAGQGQMGSGTMDILPTQGGQSTIPQGAGQLRVNPLAALQAGYSLDEIPKLDALRNLGMNKVARTVKAVGPDGKEYEYQMDDFGRPVGAPMAQYKAPIQVNRGNSNDFLDAYTLQPKASLQTFQSPDSKASNALGYARLAEEKRAHDMNNPNVLGGGNPATGASVSGDALLQSLNPQVAAQVKALAEGRMAFPAGFALKSPYWQQMISLVSQYDPSFDAVNYNARSKTRNDFTSGKAAQNLNAFNTVLGHLDSLVTAGNALDNTSYPLVNKGVNLVRQATGDSRPQAFDATKKAVVDELTRAWRGMGGSEADIKTWGDVISNASSPQQLKGVAKQIADLLQSKINAMGEQYSQGMGTTTQGIQLLTPHAQSVLKKLEGDTGNAAPAGWSYVGPVGGK